MKYYRYLITGGPGIGKTALLEELKKAGFEVSHEVARRVINENLKNDGPILPWKNRDAFDTHLIETMRIEFSTIPPNVPVFYDGSSIDLIAWREYLNLDNTDYLHVIKDFQFERKIFMPEPWEKIFETDEVRPFTFDEAVKIHKRITSLFLKLGYEIITLPKVSPSERAQIVIETVKDYMKIKLYKTED